MSKDTKICFVVERGKGAGRKPKESCLLSIRCLHTKSYSLSAASSKAQASKVDFRVDKIFRYVNSFLGSCSENSAALSGLIGFVDLNAGLHGLLLACPWVSSAGPAALL